MRVYRKILITSLAFSITVLEQAGNNLAGWLKKWQPDDVEIFEPAQADQAIRRSAVNAREDERRRIARELHDETAQLLTALRLALERLSLTGPAELKAQIQKSIDLCERAEDEVDKLIHDLRPALIDELGLVEAIKSQAEARLGEAGIALNFEVTGVERLLSGESEVALFRVVQEAVNNIVKHSGAGNVEIQLAFSGDEVVASIEDDGCGFDTRSARTSGLGLPGMKERMGLIGGSLSIASAPGIGTRLKVAVPLAEERVKV
ncbi:MAG: sensor histidine kinase [Dehalococcoidales bacterium]|nr:sensor histidine kinase [Dehalococcoidales bacterium]